MPYPDNFKLTPQPDAKLSANPPKKSKLGVEVPCMAYEQMAASWSVVDAVKGGTPEMRARGEAFLPREPMEMPDAYQRRLSKATLTPWYTRLVRGLVGMILRKPVTVLDASERLAEHLENINLLGDDISNFAREVFEAAIDYGYTGLLVDYTRVEGAVTLADEAAIAPRPYWVHYTAPEVIGFRYSTVGNRRVFTQVRILLNDVEPDGDFGERTVERVKVYDLVDGRVTWRLFQRFKDDFELVDEGMLSLPLIPFVFVYTDKKKSLVLKPPMLEVAYLNVKHFQLSADLDHSLHIAANPKLCLFGYDPENGDVVGSVDEALVFENPEGRAEWISPEAGAFEPLHERIVTVERHMTLLALSTLANQKNIGESAEAKRLDRAESNSIMAVIAQGLQDAFDLCLEYHAAYLGEPAVSCQVNRNFAVTDASPQAIAAFSNLHQKNQISLETFLELLKKGEILDDEFDVEAEIERLDEEMQRQSAKPEPTPEELSQQGLDDL